MKKSYLALAGLMLGATITVSSCGGGGGGSSGSGGDNVLTGVFIDAPVDGLEYQTSSGLSGVTSNGGEFKYRPGDTVTFKVSSVTIGDAPADVVVTPLDIVGTNDLDNNTVLTIVALMLYLDSDDNPDNGITIDATKLPQNVGNINIEQGDTIQGVTLDLTAAQTHISTSINNVVSQYIAGSYSGSYTTTQGSCGSGSVSLTIDSLGNINGYATVSAGNGGGQITITGQINYKGFSAGTAGGSVNWQGKWSNGTISGNWNDTAYNCSGTFSVSKQ